MNHRRTRSVFGVDRPVARRGERALRRDHGFDRLEARDLMTITGTTGLNPISPAPSVGLSYFGTVASFTADDQGPFSATINWGDGHSSPASIAPQNGGFAVNGSHTYVDLTVPGSPFEITVSVVDSTSPTGTPPSLITSSANVADVPILATATAFPATRGIVTPLQDVARFTVSNPFATASTYAATVDWGDSEPATQASIVEDASGVFHVEGSHLYPSVGTFPVHVNIQNNGGSKAALTTPSQATVAPSPVLASGVPIAATQGSALTGIAVAHFTDSGGAQTIDHYSASIRWGDGQTSPGTIVSVGGANLEVTGSHVYGLGGQYAASVSIASDGVVSASAISPATVASASPLLNPIPIATSSRKPFQGSVASFTLVPGATSQPATTYQATVDWGDGSPATPASVTSAGGAYVVSGSHVYGDVPSATSHSYPVTVIVSDLIGGTRTQIVEQANVAAVPIVLTGMLDPASDTGASNHDAITRDSLPRFLGSSEPGTTVTVVARPDRGSPVTLGAVRADGAGNWQITPGVALAEGRYTIVATAVDEGGVNSTTTQLLPSASEGSLTIDTEGPRIANLQFQPRTGLFTVSFAASLAGLDDQTLLNGTSYGFSNGSSKPNSPADPKFAITTLSLSTGADGLKTVTALIGKGKRLPGGLYTFRVFSGSDLGIKDLAGNSLDGEFYGFLPSGDGHPGGSFEATVKYSGNGGSPLTPIGSLASPSRPPGTPALGFQYKGGKLVLVTPKASLRRALQVQSNRNFSSTTAVFSPRPGHS